MCPPSGSVKMPVTPYVGMPAGFMNCASDAAGSRAGTTGIPGQSSCATFSIGSIIAPNCRLSLHVARTATVEVAVLFCQVERVACPVFPLCLDHIYVGKHQNRLGFGVGPVKHG